MNRVQSHTLWDECDEMGMYLYIYDPIIYEMFTYGVVGPVRITTFIVVELWAILQCPLNTHIIPVTDTPGQAQLDHSVPTTLSGFWLWLYRTIV